MLQSVAQIRDAIDPLASAAKDTPESIGHRVGFKWPSYSVIWTVAAFISNCNLKNRQIYDADLTVTCDKHSCKSGESNSTLF